MVSGAGDDVCNLFGSSVRTKVLLSLYGGVKTREDLKEALGCSPQSVSTQAKWLGEKGLLERRGKGRYRLTLSGRAMAFKLIEVRKLYRAIEKHHGFWAAHEVEAIISLLAVLKASVIVLWVLSGVAPASSTMPLDKAPIS